MDTGDVQRFLLGLPEVEQYEHGGRPSFRVRGRRFASMLDDRGVNLAPGEEAIRATVGQWPGSCHEEWFGDRLAAVRVEFAKLEREVVEELLLDAWAAKAPKKLVRSYQERGAASRGRGVRPPRDFG
jgi:hypothetical protein